MKEQIRAVDHLARLLGDGGRQALVPVAERPDADPREQVEVFATFLVVHMDALAAHQHDRRAPVGLNDVFRFELANLTRHDALFLSCRRDAVVPLVICVLLPAPAARP